MSKKIPYLAQRDVGAAVNERLDFNASNMRGRNVKSDVMPESPNYYYPECTHPGDVQGCSWGRMDRDDRTALRNDRPTYIVWSYSTPIMWWSEASGWVVPNIKYSSTTSHHQTYALRGVATHG